MCSLCFETAAAAKPVCCLENLLLLASGAARNASLCDI